MKLVELYNRDRNPNFDRYFTDKWQPYHTYLEYYDKEFLSYKKSVKLLEIGVCWGGSILLWTKYFDKYDITGVDITSLFLDEEGNSNHEEIKKDKNVKLHLGVSSRDKTFADNTFEDELFDIIVEDGDHTVPAQVETFKAYFSKIKKDGSYYIEDVMNENCLKQLLEELKKIGGDSINLEVYRGDLSKRGDDIIVKVKHR